jgi:hypothetical protein
VARQTITIAAANTAALPTDLAAAATEDDDDAAAVLAMRIEATKRLEFYCLGLVLGYGYGPGAGTQTTDGTDFAPGPLPGNRLPHRWIRPGLSLYDRLGPGFTLIGEPALAGPLRSLATQRGVPLTVAGDLGADSRDVFGADLVLVRPDQHIAWLGECVTPAAAPAILTNALTGFGGI